MEKFLMFVKHKTAGWVGVVYLSEDGKMRVCNGVFDWPLTPEREEKVDTVQAKDVDLTTFFRLLNRSCDNPFSGMGRIRNIVFAQTGISSMNYSRCTDAALSEKAV